MEEGYTYSNLQSDIQKLKESYPFLEVGNIGYSVLGRAIPYIRIGSGQKEVFYNASFHANEWITTPVLMRFIEDYSAQYVLNGRLNEYSARELYNAVSLFIVPMVNPDGVDLVTGGLKNVDNPYKSAQEIAKAFPNIPFPSGWKANIDGVDLNLQFPAGWAQAKEIKFAQGFNKPAPRDFVGEGPLVAREALAVYNFTLQHNFRLVIAYHTQGQEIYWKYLNYQPVMAQFIGQQFSRVSGYTLAEVSYNSSFAGYKDWFVQNYNRPGYTIEAGIGKNPLPVQQFSEIYRDNFGILVLGLVL
jgi:g-D-glutamyl-meso-diaminopimelate peptidase